MAPGEGFIPGGGATPAETTMPIAIDWSAMPGGAPGSAPPRPGAPRREREPGVPEDLPPGTRRVEPRYPPRRPAGSPGPGGHTGHTGHTGLAGPAAPTQPVPTRPHRRGERAVAGPGLAGQRRSLNRNLMKSSAGMAVGTLITRGTGFLRTLVLVYALGTEGIGNAYNNANNLPNTVYYLMLGGVFTSVIVPLLVRAARRDPDNGEAYAQRIFTLGVVSLLGVTLVATALAAPIVDLVSAGVTQDRNAMIIWAYVFMPQIFFYGMNALIGAVLNTRGSFAAPMWTPTVNNLVVIIFGALYIVSGLGKSATTISSSGVQLLALGTMAGIILQTVALVPSLRRVGFRWRPVLGFQPGELGEIRQMTGWMSAYVVTQFAGYLVVQIIANKASKNSAADGYSAYAYAWQLFQLPYAVIGISVITALLPRMSDHAGGRKYSQVRNDFSTGVRLSSVIVVPAAIYLGVLGGPLAEFLLAYGHESTLHARYIGEVFGLFSLGLVPYMLTQLQLRIFYSFQDSRTAALVGLLTMATGIAGDLIAYSVLPSNEVVAGLAVAYGVANLIGALAGWILILRRVGSLDGWSVARSLTRMHLATVPGLVFALLIMLGAGHVMHNPGRSYGLVVTVVGGGGAIALYAIFARKLRVAEFGFLMRTVAGRFGGQSGRH